MYMIEGIWIGYRSSQDHVVHRTYHRKSDKKFVERVKALGHSITFTDGTSLRLTVSEVTHKTGREIHGYDSLIRDCAYAGVNSVAALAKAESR